MLQLVANIPCYIGAIICVIWWTMTLILSKLSAIKKQNKIEVLNNQNKNKCCELIANLKSANTLCAPMCPTNGSPCAINISFCLKALGT